MISPELIAYIRKQKELGIPEVKYRENLISQGWKIEDIDEALSSISQGVPLPPLVSPSKNYSLMAKVIATIVVLICLPLILEILLTILFVIDPFIFFQNGGFDGFYVLLHLLEGLSDMLVLLLIIFVIVGFITNYVVKKRFGQREKYLTVMNILSILTIIAWFLTLVFARISGIGMGGKPVIYLYPQKDTNVSLTLKLQGVVTDTYPTIDAKNSWNVIAHPDGTLTNSADNKEYSYLFWEGIFTHPIALPDKGFVVSGKDTKDFLQKTLSQMGLTPKEYNEFIVYWLPKMQHNPYNQIYFATNDYTDKATLEVTPKPDSVLRVFMGFKSLNSPIVVEPETVTPFVRKGFTLVEWGGDQVN